jgi:hypothetical protein
MVCSPTQLDSDWHFKTRPLARAYDYIDNKAKIALLNTAYEISLRYSATCGATAMQDGPSKQLAGISKT